MIDFELEYEAMESEPKPRRGPYLTAAIRRLWMEVLRAYANRR